MIGLDTNILVYAFQSGSEWNAAARKCMRGLAEATGAWAIPWPCIHEFLAVVTNPRAFTEPASLGLAIEAVGQWMASPSLRLIGESPVHWQQLKSLLQQGKLAGPAVHDARIAAICIEHGVTELWTADRDFHRMPGLRVRNPLLAWD